MNSIISFLLFLIFAVAVLTLESEKSQWQEGDRWIWGYFEENTPNEKIIKLPDPKSRSFDINATLPRSTEVTNFTTQTTQAPTTSTTEATTPETSTTEAATTVRTTTKKATSKPHYCEGSYVPPEKPDYSMPGRRVNEAKCLEYVWQLNDRIRKTDQSNECKKYERRSWRRRFGGGGGHAVGGRKTKPGEFPHMGAVGWKATVGSWVFKCGSSLISERFVLTAAHCTVASTRDPSIADPVPKIIRIGDKNIIDRTAYNSPPKKDVNIYRIIVHPKYKSPVKYYDIALMELEENVKFTKYVQPACLWNTFGTGDLGTQATLTGWGTIESDSHQISPELQAATVDVLESDQCDQLLKSAHNRNWDGFHDDQICAGKLAGGIDSCQGDSGGPLQMKMPLPQASTDREGSMHYVIGVISFGVGCAHHNLPGMYTRVSSFVDWIEDNVWNGNHTETVDNESVDNET